MGNPVYEQLLERLGEASPQPRLTAIQRLTELLGDPQHSAPVVHIAGTNGKSSVSRMIESILRSYGLRTGLFVSPHLEVFNERIVIDGEPVDDETLTRTWNELLPIFEFVDVELIAAGELPVTFFEAMTALAFVIFADAPVDVMVIEVGMGGEWDATNVVHASVAVFTPIDLDHMKQLGNTTAEIARTKAGILKSGALAVTAEQTDDVLEVLRESAESHSVKLIEAGADFSLQSATGAVGGQIITVRGLRGEYVDVPLSLYGTHQAQNASLAIAAAELLLAEQSSLSMEYLVEALSTVSSPGRFERISADPLILVDAAHNPHGASALVKTLVETFPERECGFLIGTLSDKDRESIVRKLGSISNTFFVSTPLSERAISAEALANTVRDQLADAEVHERDSIADAFESFRDWVSGSESRVGVVTGSIVFIGDILTYSKNRQEDHE